MRKESSRAEGKERTDGNRGGKLTGRDLDRRLRELEWPTAAPGARERVLEQLMRQVRRGPRHDPSR